MAVPKESRPADASYHLKAVIDIGSTSIRMVVAQVHENGRFQTLDALSQNVAIGIDTFTRGRISPGTIGDAVKVLRNFSTVLSEYGIDVQKDVRAVATSAVREARNSEELLDRIEMATDIAVDVIAGMEVNRLTFLAVQPVLKANPVLRRNRLLVAEVGGGSTELLGLQDARVSFAHTYRMGSHRLRESMDEHQGSESRKRQVLETEIETYVRQCRETVKDDVSKVSMLLLGGEARLAAQLTRSDWDGKSLVQIKVSDFAKLAERVLKMDVEQIVQKYHLHFEQAQTLGPALFAYLRLANSFSLKKVYICGVSLRDGLLAESAAGGVWSEDFVDQILHSVKEVGMRYDLDQGHADCVTGIARSLFRAMENEHRLEYRYEVILTVAAQLHEVGMFIGSSGHHKHSKYIIENSEIFGLGEEDIQLASLVARYHRRASPRSTHPGYATLQREERLVVNKLSAILRAADALDRSHTQTINKVNVVVDEEQVTLVVPNAGDFSAEKRALAEKGKLFEQVYGRTILLRTKRR